VGPYGAHSRLQHSPQPLQTSPLTLPQLVGAEGGAAQVPSAAFAALVQIPEQQSVLLPQASLRCTQNEAPTLQVPAWQRPEQQSRVSLQGLPAVLQALVSGVQLPLSQAPLQQSAGAWQAWLSAMQAVSEQLPPVQLRVQQSRGLLQAAPEGLHSTNDESHWLVSGLQ
jgi:hypothetical protein